MTDWGYRFDVTQPFSYIQTLDELCEKLANYSCPKIAQVEIALDILSSMLQKALRRADKDSALIAAHGLIAVDPDMFWRRLTGITFEDFGHSNLNLTWLIVSVARSRSVRKSCGDFRLASYLIGELILTPKDRRVDDLYMLAVAHARSHVYHSGTRLSSMAQELLSYVVTLCLRCERQVPRRSFRAVVPAACDEAITKIAHLPAGVTQLLTQGRKTSQCLLPVVMAHSLALETVGTTVELRTIDLATERQGGVLLPSLDGYTTVGRTILSQLVREHKGLSQLLRHACGISPERSAAMLLFCIEGGLLRSYMSTPLTEEIRNAARGCWSGLPPSLLPEALHLMRNLLPTINDRRRAVLASHQPENGAINGIT